MISSNDNLTSTSVYHNNDNELLAVENHPMSTLSIVFATLYSFTFLFGIFTNSIVVLVFAIKSEFRQYTNYFFANLSIADILVLIVCIPVAITDLFSPDVWNYGALYCKMYYFIEYCVTSVSSLTIIIISIERFFAIASPWTVKQLFNERRSKAAIVFVWVFGLAISIPVFSMVEYTTQPPTQCQLIMTEAHVIYVCVLNIMLIFVPTVGLAFLYILIIIKLKDHYKMLFTPPHGNSLRVEGRHSTATSTAPPTITVVANVASVTDDTMTSPAVSCFNDNVLRMHRNHSKNRQPHQVVLNRNQLKSTLNQANGKVANELLRSYQSGGETRSCSICFGGHGKRYECRCMTTMTSSPPHLTEVAEEEATTAATSNTAINRPRSNSLHRQHLAMKVCSASQPKLFFGRASLQSGGRGGESCRSSKQLNHLSTSKMNFTIVISCVTMAFFFCQLPCRGFLLWSYLTHYFSPPMIDRNATVTAAETLSSTNSSDSIGGVESNLFFIDLIANSTKLIYFLHCISNPIIYNIMSIKFRKAFLSMTMFNKTNDCRFSIKG